MTNDAVISVETHPHGLWALQQKWEKIIKTFSFIHRMNKTHREGQTPLTTVTQASETEPQPDLCRVTLHFNSSSLSQSAAWLHIRVYDWPEMLWITWHYGINHRMMKSDANHMAVEEQSIFPRIPTQILRFKLNHQRRVSNFIQNFQISPGDEALKKPSKNQNTFPYTITDCRGLWV